MFVDTSSFFWEVAVYQLEDLSKAHSNASVRIGALDALEQARYMVDEKNNDAQEQAFFDSLMIDLIELAYLSNDDVLESELFDLYCLLLPKQHFQIIRIEGITWLR